jgi:CheY-like chemotaxis protein
VPPSARTLIAFAMRGDEQRAHDAGCDGYITKPIDTRALPALVAGYLQRLKPKACDSYPGKAFQHSQATRHYPGNDHYNFHMTILVADDDATNRTLLFAILGGRWS